MYHWILLSLNFLIMTCNPLFVKSCWPYTRPKYVYEVWRRDRYLSSKYYAQILLINSIPLCFSTIRSYSKLWSPFIPRAITKFYDALWNPRKKRKKYICSYNAKKVSSFFKEIFIRNICKYFIYINFFLCILILDKCLFLLRSSYYARVT